MGGAVEEFPRPAERTILHFELDDGRLARHFLLIYGAEKTVSPSES